MDVVSRINSNISNRNNCYSVGKECAYCSSKCYKFTQKYIKWEIVLILVNVLVLSTIVHKYIVLHQLDYPNKSVFRSLDSFGHITQGLLFVLLLAPFNFYKRITRYILKKNRSIEFDEHGYADDVEIAKTNEELNKMVNTNNKSLESVGSKSLHKKPESVEGTSSGSNENDKAEEVKLKKREYDKTILVAKAGSPKHKIKEMEYFFTCAMLFTTPPNHMLFTVKYFTTFCLMFSYPLYNLIKRKLLYEYFFYSSYATNQFDFAFGLLVGTSIVLIYGIIGYTVSYFKNKNKAFSFYDNYPFVNDVTCLCDPNIKLNIEKHTHITISADAYLSSYFKYKIILTTGLVTLMTVTALAFYFNFESYYEVQNLKSIQEPA